MAFAGAAALVLLLGAWRGNAGKLRGDEGTYTAMAASLARDGDLLFDSRDEAWARAQPERPAALILQRTARGFSYSKPILYPLLAAPFYAALGANGLLAFNVAAVTLALLLAAAALPRRESGELAVETLLLFVGASIVLPYLAWKMTESLQTALSLAGLALALGGELGSAPAGSRAGGRASLWLTRPGARYSGAVLLGLLVALREPNAAVAVVPVLAAAAGRRFGRAALLGATSAATYAACALLAIGLTGTASPYKALRSTFDGASGYPSAGPREAARFGRQQDLATSDLEAIPELEVRQSSYAALYFFVGRHAGLIAYFPAALALLWALAGGSDRIGRSALFGFAAAAGFYLVWWPQNFFGGETCIGNRYLLAAYPCLLFAPRRLPSRRALGVAWLLAAGFGLSAAVSVARTRALDPSSQNHAYAGLFRWLPYESVASEIDGRRDRYWSGDFLRFVDPFARVDRSSFLIDSGSPAAEVELATAWSGRPLQFLVRTNTPRATIVVSDWLGRDRFPLAEIVGGSAGGLVVAYTSPPWRWHPFWFQDRGDYRARLLRFALETPGGRAATAELRYLGPRGIPAEGFEREVLRVALPATAPAGGVAKIPLELRHRGSWAWDSDAPLPVLVGIRLEAIDGGARREQRAPLPHRVEPGGRVVMALPLRWPAEPGRYRVVVDLVLEGVCWFGERVGEPVASAVVTVTPAAAPAAPPAPSRR